MNLSRASIQRPIFTTMVVLIVLILGGISLLRLPIDLMPDITYPTVSIRTTYSNASPEEMEELVTRPIEEAMSAVPGVTEVTSSSTEGVSNVRVTFAWGTDLDTAANDIRDRLDRVMGRLPDDCDRPTLRKFDVAAFPILILGASSDMEPVQFRRLIEDQVKYRIERVPGVASLDIFGGLVREIHVNLYADKIKALGLSLDQVIARIEASNVNLPAGTIDRGNYEVTIRTPGEYTSIEELRRTVIAVRDGAPVELGDIARVEDSWEKVRQHVRVNARPGIRLGVSKQSGTNTVEVANRVLEELQRINEDIPQISIVPIIDTSAYIKRSISNVGSSALYGGLLAALVLLMFLREFRSTAIISAAIPISIVATFVLMYFCGFTVNLMTLGGLALGVGMMVDNSIVVLENLYRLCQEEGLDSHEAAVRGSEEVVAAVIASTVTTVVVFLPLVYVRGMAGVMFKQLSIVIAFSLLCSLAVAITLVPMLAARFVRPVYMDAFAGESLWHRIFSVSGRFFQRMETSYKQLLKYALDHRGLVVGTTTALLAGCLLLARFVGAELMPQTDEGEVRITAEMEVGTRLEVTDEKLRLIEAIVQESVPEMKSMVATAGGGLGGGGTSGPHVAEVRVALKPRRERKRSSEQVANDIRRRLTNIPGVVVRTRAGQGLFILRMGLGGAERLQIEVRGHDFEVANALAQQVKRIVAEIEGVTDVVVSREAGAPEELIVIDRQKAADMKLTVSQIAGALQTCLAGTRAGSYREAGDEYRILVKLEGAEKMDLRDILDLTISNADGQPIVLRNVVHVRPQTGPTRVDRKNQERIVTVSANFTGRDMGSILRDARQRLSDLPMPGDFSVVFAGDYEEQQKAFRELLLSLALSLVLVYMVMACQYESLRDPFIVMFSVPLASVGVMLALLLTETTFNVQSFIGCIMLGGIVVNNAIVLVDHTNLLMRRNGMPLREAIEEAGRRRLRPILMTALTTTLGLLPLALGLGEGGEAQAPLARVVIGGLVSSTAITLVVIPVVYSLFERAENNAPSLQQGQCV